MTPKPRLRLALGLPVLILLAVLVSSCTTAADGQAESSGGRAASSGVAVEDGICDPRPGAPAMGVFRGSGDPASIDEFQEWLGCDVEYVVEFAARGTWDKIANPGYLVEQWRDDPRTLVLSIGLLPTQEEASMQAGARGEYNEYFVSLAESLVAGGRPDALIRLGWEFNLEGSNWRTDDPEVFREFWRQTVDALRSVNGQRFQFIWNPGRSGVDAVPYYPGDDVVDYIGIDVYDATGAPGTYPYPLFCDEACKLERQITAWNDEIYGGETGLAYYSRFARERGKQVMIPEWGLWERDDGNSGGENLYFLRQMYNFLYEPANNVVMHAYFEWDAGQGDHRLMDTFLEAGDLFRELFVYRPPAAPVSSAPQSIAEQSESPAPTTAD